MKKFTEILNLLAAIDKDEAELDKIEAGARADMVQAAAGKLSLENAKKKINEANMTCDFVSARRGKITAPYAELMVELHRELIGQADAWNAGIIKAMESIEASVIEATTQFFNGKASPCRGFWDEGNMIRLPIFADYREAIYPTIGLASMSESQLEATVKHFMRHIKRHGENLGITLADLETITQ